MALLLDYSRFHLQFGILLKVLGRSFQEIEKRALGNECLPSYFLPLRIRLLVDLATSLQRLRRFSTCMNLAFRNSPSPCPTSVLQADRISSGIDLSLTV